MRNISVEEIIPLLDSEHKILGERYYYFNNVKPSELVNEESLDWVGPLNRNKAEYILKSKARIILCDATIKIESNMIQNKCLIVVKNPKATLIKILNHFFVEKSKFQIHPSAIIHPDAKINNDCYVGPFSYIGKCEIGSGTIIEGHCYIYDNVIIGKNVKIHAGTVVGADGFGYVKDDQGSYVRFPHIGRVFIGDNVEIGSNTSINRGALSNTIIEDGVKIDDHVHISHNVKIGKNSAITANVVIAGSSVIGENSWVAPSAVIRDNIKVGKKVTIGMGASVSKNVPDTETWLGFPAMPFFDMARILRKFKK